MTTLFGFDRVEVSSLAHAVSAADPSDVFARSTWTCLAEPGDRLAGVLVAALGAGPALTLLIERTPVAKIAELLGEAEVDDSLLEQVQAGIDRWLPRLSPATAKRALTQAARFGLRFVVPSDNDWPRRVDDLGAHAPIGLWLRGRVEALGSLSQSISLVGARAATGYGEHITMEASAGLVDRGFAIVSGAAYGIDGMAHRAAIASRGTTIAFLAGGLDRFYPAGHDALLARIVETGAVLSEVPCGVTPTKWRFLQRNRLIAAVSQATIVLEAGWRSGSLNTAGHALDVGRPVGAVPGPVTSAASAGCHRLIRDKPVTLVTNAEEMAALAGSGVEPVETGFSDQHSDAARLLDAMSTRSARSASDLAVRSGLAVGTVQALLGALELDGRAREIARGWLLPPPPKAEKK
jgi:DNA processing protein